MSDIERHDKAFFSAFASSIQSGDHVRVMRGLRIGAQHVFDSLSRLAVADHGKDPALTKALRRALPGARVRPAGSASGCWDVYCDPEDPEAVPDYDVWWLETLFVLVIVLIKVIGPSLSSAEAAGTDRLRLELFVDGITDRLARGRSAAKR
jgi:hypothetical protein